MTIAGKSKYVTVWLEYTLFLFYCLMSIRIIFVSFYHASLLEALWLLSILFTLTWLTFRNVRWSLYGFVAAIPLVSGLQIVGFIQNIPILSFGFAGIYLSWLSRRILFDRKTILPATGTEILVDILSAIIIVSFFAHFISNLPFYLLKMLWITPFQNANTPLYGIEAAYLILQGLFLYRIIRMEVSDAEMQHVVSIIYIQATIIILFSTIQLIFNIPAVDTKLGGAAVYSPFDDKHSFGSYLVLLFFVFLFLLNFKINTSRFMNGIFVILMFILIILSWSRVTWLAVGILLIVFAFRAFSSWKYIAPVLALVAGTLVFINIFYSSALLQSDNRYVKRFGGLIVISKYAEDINVKFRLCHWKRAVRMIRDHPLTGSGVGSYYRLSPSYAGPGESHYMIWGSRENTHNYYLQFAADMGIPALILFMMIVFCSFRAGLSFIPKDNSRRNIVPGIVFGLTGYLVTCITGHPLLLTNQQLLFWSALAVIPVSVAPPEDSCLCSGQSSCFRWLLGLLLSLVLISYGVKFWSPSSSPTTYEYGFHEYENWGGKKMRWTMKESHIRLRASGEIFSFNVIASPHNAGSGDLYVSLFLNGRLHEKLLLRQNASERLAYPIPCKKGELFELKILVNRTFNPYKLGLSDDRRDLGVAISELEFVDETPSAGIGFYSPEVWQGEISGWPQDRLKEFRWTGKSAIMSIRDGFINGVTLFILCAHPEVATFPVELKIIGRGRVIRHEVFKDNVWKRIRIQSDDIKDSETLAFVVNRTWNPMRAGISEDRRNLGIAVAVVEE